MFSGYPLKVAAVPGHCAKNSLCRPRRFLHFCSSRGKPTQHRVTVTILLIVPSLAPCRGLPSVPWVPIGPQPLAVLGPLPGRDPSMTLTNPHHGNHLRPAVPQQHNRQGTLNAVLHTDQVRGHYSSDLETSTKMSRRQGSRNVRIQNQKGAGRVPNGHLSRSMMSPGELGQRQIRPKSRKIYTNFVTALIQQRAYV